MLPRKFRRCLGGLALAGLVGAVGGSEAFAGEKARISAPVTPPKRDLSGKKTFENSPAPFRSLKSGDSTGAVVDAPALPTVPPLDPAAQRQLLDRLDQEKNWLLDERMMDSPDPARALEEEWDLGGDTDRDPTSVLERRLNGRKVDGRSDKEGGKGRRDSEQTRKGDRQPDDEGDENGFALRRNDARQPGELKISEERELNPFVAVSPESRISDFLSGERSSPKDNSGFASALLPGAKDLQQRADRYGVVFGGAEPDRGFAARSSQFGEERQSRMEQFDRAFGGSDLNGLGGGTAPATAPSFAAPSKSAGLFDAPLSGFAAPLAAPSLPTPSRGALDAISQPRLSIQPLPKPTF